MQYHWLNKQNNENLIIFFAGWSFDYKPFEFLSCKDYDILMIYDYNDISNVDEIFHSDIPNNSGKSLEKYRQKFLIAWSMGVYVAYLLRNQLPKFDKKIAINGTPFPVDDEFGIPQKTFILTLRHAKIGLEGKFYQNIFKTDEEYQKYIQTPVERPIDNRVSELNELYKKIKATANEYEKYYDKSLISSFDKIIPTKNQTNFWQTFDTPIQTIESGHFPYYNFDSWKDLL